MSFIPKKKDLKILNDLQVKETNGFIGILQKLNADFSKRNDLEKKITEKINMEVKSSMDIDEVLMKYNENNDIDSLNFTMDCGDETITIATRRKDVSEPVINVKKASGMSIEHAVDADSFQQDCLCE